MFIRVFKDLYVLALSSSFHNIQETAARQYFAPTLTAVLVGWIWRTLKAAPSWYVYRSFKRFSEREFVNYWPSRSFHFHHRSFVWRLLTIDKRFPFLNQTVALMNFYVGRLDAHYTWKIKIIQKNGLADTCLVRIFASSECKDYVY
jgi:uncharacterized protein Usg